MSKARRHRWTLTNTHLRHFFCTYCDVQSLFNRFKLPFHPDRPHFFPNLCLFLKKKKKYHKNRGIIVSGQFDTSLFPPSLFPTFVQSSERLLTSFTLSLSSEVTHTASPFHPPPHPPTPSTPPPAAVTVGKQCATPHRPSLKDERASGVLRDVSLNAFRTGRWL